MKQLEDLKERIEQLLPRGDALWGTPSETRPPDDITADALGFLGKLAAQPRSSRLRSLESGSASRAFAGAVAELEQNVARLEALVEELRWPPFAYVTWAWRVHQSLQAYHAASFAVPVVVPAQDEAAPPPKGTPAPRDQPFGPARALRPPLHEVGSKGAGRGVAVVDPLLDLAARETGFLQRRRRLLEAARRALLEADASAELPTEEVQDRLLHVTEQIRTLNRLQSAGIHPTVSLAQQLKQATARRDVQGAARCLEAFSELGRLGSAAAPTVSLLARSHDKVPEAVTQVFVPKQISAGHPPGVLDAVTRGMDAARTRSGLGTGSLGPIGEQLAAQAWGQQAIARVFTASANVDGCFELGRSVAPVRTTEEQSRMREVPYPTQTMMLRPAECVTEIPTSLVRDPRTLLLDFATGRLLARCFLGRPTLGGAPGERVREARYYLLDGSDSMGGRRGVLRDALLVSELSSLIQFLAEPGAAAVRPVVYYRYFTKSAKPTHRVATREEALEAIEDCIGGRRKGGTDIEAALLASLEEVRLERERDEVLKRVHLVLVTDGVSRIDLRTVWAARERLGDIPVGISVISLGSENETLKRLAAAQRRAGQEVFYHYLPDQNVRELVEPAPAVSMEAAEASGRADAAAPSDSDGQELTEDSGSEGAKSEGRAVPSAAEEDDWQELELLVDELVALESPADLDEVEHSRFVVEALSEVGLSLQFDLCEAQRARHESLRREERTLKRRFDRWFPPGVAAATAPSVAEVSVEPMLTIEALLAAVLEVMEILDGSPLQRRYDAIEVMERLLLEAGLPPWLYAREMERASPLARWAVAELRRVAAARD